MLCQNYALIRLLNKHLITLQRNAYCKMQWTHNIQPHTHNCLRTTWNIANIIILLLEERQISVQKNVFSSSETCPHTHTRISYCVIVRIEVFQKRTLLKMANNYGISDRSREICKTRAHVFNSFQWEKFYLW